MTPFAGLALRTGSPEATVAAGRALGAVLDAGDLLALNGVLGAGKTCFVRGLVAGLGGEEDDVRSPTFVLHQVHLGGRHPLHHMDLFRLPAAADVTFLEIDELLVNGVVVVEWAARGDLRGLEPIDLTFSVEATEGRVIRLAGPAPPRMIQAWAGVAT